MRMIPRIILNIFLDLCIRGSPSAVHRFDSQLDLILLNASLLVKIALMALYLVENKKEFEFIPFWGRSLSPSLIIPTCFAPIFV